jgi:hypothetical protein
VRAPLPPLQAMSEQASKPTRSDRSDMTHGQAGLCQGRLFEFRSDRSIGLLCLSGLSVDNYRYNRRARVRNITSQWETICAIPSFMLRATQHKERGSGAQEMCIKISIKIYRFINDKVVKFIQVEMNIFASVSCTIPWMTEFLRGLLLINSAKLI